MTPELVELAQRLVAAPWWSLPNPGGCGRGDAGLFWVPSDAVGWEQGGSGSPVPELTDDATGGALLAMLPPCRVVKLARPSGPQWRFVLRVGDHDHAFVGDHLAEAAARALLAVRGEA